MSTAEKPRKTMPGWVDKIVDAKRIMAVRETAVYGYNDGYCIVPPAGPMSDNPKKPLSEYVEGKYTWEHWQEERPPWKQVDKWFLTGANYYRAWIGVVCGKVSGNLEMFEFDSREAYERFKEAARVLGLGDLIDRIEAGYCEDTPSGGVHWFYKCEVIAGNTPIAKRPKRPEKFTDKDREEIAKAAKQGRVHIPVQVLIETRGEGGFGVIAPTIGLHENGKAYELRSGSLKSVVTITPEERQALWDLAKTFDEAPEAPPAVEIHAREGDPIPRAKGDAWVGPAASNGHGADGWEVRPGDDFNTRGSWLDILPRLGFTQAHASGNVIYWCRPGKSEGWSATTGFGDADLLYVFSTSTEFQAQHWYTKAAVYTKCFHQGDWTAAAKALLDLGYGVSKPKIHMPGYYGATGDGRDAAAAYAAATEPQPEPGAEAEPEPEPGPPPPDPDAECEFWGTINTASGFATAVLDSARMAALAWLRRERPDVFEAIRIGLTRCPGYSARSFKGILDKIDRERPKPADPPPFTTCPPGQEENPHRLARLYLHEHHAGACGELRLRYWRSEFHAWLKGVGSYRAFLNSEVRADVARVLEEEFKNIYTAHMIRWKMRMKGGKGGDEGGGGEPPRLHEVTTGLVGNVIQALASLTLVKTAEHPRQPTWLDDPGVWAADEMLPAPNALVHLPSFVAGKPCTIRPTSRYFSPYALGFDFDPNAPPPVNWLTFLGARPLSDESPVKLQLWPDDDASIEALQEWFGYLLSQDKSQQKILALVGPKRCGKGTILRILKAMLGEANVVNPTLSSLAEHFGLEPLLGKSVAAITDARIGGGTNTAEIVERMLSVSGEDDQTVHRKNKEAWTGRLPTRFVVATNDLPSVSDPSGAFAGRFIILRFTKSFYGQEDKGLTNLLMTELPGILLWAIQGWDRLRQRGYLMQPESGADLVKRLEALSSPITAFLEECCLIDPSQQTPREKLYERWKEWCKEHGRDRPGNSDSFGRNLHSAIPNLKSSRPWINDKKTYVYVGVGIRAESSRPPLSPAALWLKGYLSRGESPIGQAIEAAGLAGFKEANEVFSAAREIEAVMYDEVGSKKKYWKLPPSSDFPIIPVPVDYTGAY